MRFNRLRIIIIYLLGTLLVGCSKYNQITEPIIAMELFGEKNVIINFGCNYIDEGVLITEDGTDVSAQAEVISNLDKYSIGEYTIEYIYNNKSLIRNVKVIDTQPPKIILQGNSTVYIAEGQVFTEPGYEAMDNYDGDISQAVIVKNDVDIHTEGEYILEYTVQDSSCNITSANRTVVVKTSPLTQSLEEFTLKNLFEDTILPEHAGDLETFESTTVMIGDSRNQSFAYYDLIDENNVWGTEGLTPFKIYDKKVLHHGTLERRHVMDMVAKYQPKIIIFSMGVECVGAYPPEDIADAYRKFLQELMEEFPDTKIVIHSMMPVHEKYDLHSINIWHPSNQKINIVNYYLAGMCADLGIYYIDSSSVLKNEKGLGDPQYFTDDKVHLNAKGQTLIFDYILSHSLLTDE